MAHRSPLSTVPNTPLLNGQRFDDVVTAIEQPRLPAGECNFTILNAAGGGIGTKCGCRRYYDKPPVDTNRRAVLGQSGYCMCEHHACFHEHEVEGRQGSRVSRDIQLPTMFPIIPKVEVRQATLGAGQLRSLANEGSGSLALRDSQLPDTLQWSRFIHSGTPEALPAIPSQCLLPSDNGSGTSGSQCFRPFGGIGLDTLNHIPKPTPKEHLIPKTIPPLRENNRAMQFYEDANGNPCLQSLTEVATASAQTSPANTQFGKIVADARDALEKLTEGHPQSAASSQTPIKEAPNSHILVKQSDSHPAMESAALANESDDYLIPRLRSVLARIASFPTKMDNHEIRLGRLENYSSTNPLIEDLQTSHNVMDVTMSEIEARLEDLETARKYQNDVNSVSSHRDVNASIDSRISTTSSALIAAAIDQVDYARLEALEARVAELQACAPPSHNRPWEVEVVFLPFGSYLQGVWSAHHSIPQPSGGNSGAEDSWTQTQNQSLAAAQASLAAQEQASAWENSAIDFVSDENAAWLTAKACKSGSMIDERLQSRGLVKVVKVKGPDARDVQAAIMLAFGDVPGLLVEDPFTQHEDEETNKIPGSLSRYLGLQASWIPLRKLHKNSSLRFLSTSEMITPALWTVQFLSSSVAMRSSGLRRLYVTQRDSYIQHHGDVADWTWQKLRQLPRIYPDRTGTDHTPEADAHEPCWEYNERLDPPPLSVHSSFESHVSSLSIRSLRFEEEPVSPSDHFSSAAASLSVETTYVAPPTRMLSPLVDRNPFRPLHIRTSSMRSLPSMVPLKSPAQLSKRRITSFEQETHSSSTIHASTSASTSVGKRRRISRSPSRPQVTPRWSNGPPSPYAVVEDTAGRKRGTTPFAYATPHSNAPYKPDSPQPIEIWQDKEGEEDAGSATNEMSEDLEDNDGWDQNALSDFEPETSEPTDSASLSPEDEQRHQPEEEEWQGVEEELAFESRPVNIGLGIQIRAGCLTPRLDEDLEDMQSNASSQPSEYPSTQQGMYSRPNKADFEIHVDEEAHL